MIASPSSNAGNQHEADDGANGPRECRDRFGFDKGKRGAGKTQRLEHATRGTVGAGSITIAAFRGIATEH